MCIRDSPTALKNIARENYFMKADDEDIFVLSDDQATQQSKSTDEATE